MFPHGVAFALVLTACSAAGPVPPETPAGERKTPEIADSSEKAPGTEGAGESVIQAGADPTDATGIGAACTPSREEPRGTCAEGLFCLPVPGGYCASMCGEGIECGPGAVCIDSHRGGQGCAARCDSDADCRVDEGYACAWSWA